MFEITFAGSWPLYARPVIEDIAVGDLALSGEAGGISQFFSVPVCCIRTAGSFWLRFAFGCRESELNSANSASRLRRAVL